MKALVIIIAVIIFAMTSWAGTPTPTSEACAVRQRLKALAEDYGAKARYASELELTLSKQQHTYAQMGRRPLQTEAALAGLQADVTAAKASAAQARAAFDRFDDEVTLKYGGYPRCDGFPDLK